MTFDQFLQLPLLHPAGPLSAELQRKLDTIAHNHFHVHTLNPPSQLLSNLYLSSNSTFTIIILAKVLR